MILNKKLGVGVLYTSIASHKPIENSTQYQLSAALMEGE